MASPADRQREAQADLERITHALYDALTLHVERKLDPWPAIPEGLRMSYRAAVAELLHRDLVRVGQRPSVEAPMTGQTAFDPFALEDDCDAED